MIAQQRMKTECSGEQADEGGQDGAIDKTPLAY